MIEIRMRAEWRMLRAPSPRTRGEAAPNLPQRI